MPGEARPGSPLTAPSPRWRLIFSSDAQVRRRSSSVLIDLIRSLLSLAFPTVCSLCSSEILDVLPFGLCPACWEDLKPWAGPICFPCGLPLASEAVLDSREYLCGDCRHQAFAFDFARSYGVYAGKLRSAILQVKFNGRERLGRRLGALLAAPCLSLNELQETGPPVLIPVPLHRRRERERGFNQARLLAEGLRRQLSEKRATARPLVDSSSLVRSRATPPQTGLSVSARHENMRGVFVVRTPERVRDRLVLLVDDVMTTGATLSACAAALKRAGATAVGGITLARATPQIPDTDSLSSEPVDAAGTS